MLTVKFRKKYKQFVAGDTATVTNNEAFGLVEAKVASVVTSQTASEAPTYQAKIVTEEPNSLKYKTKGN